jgi:hypothetical protein
MKKVIVFAFILVSFYRVFGQMNRFEIGAEGSPSLIFLFGNKVLRDNHKPFIGFSGGAYFQYNFSKMISLRTDIAFERKGSCFPLTFTNEIGETIEQITAKTNFNYLTMPVLLRITLGKKIKFFANSGVFFGYLIKQTSVFHTKIVSPSLRKQDNTSFDKRFDFGISMGLGFSIPIKERFQLSFELRNNMGLLNISAVGVYGNGTIQTNSTNLLIGFGYKFGQAKKATN